MSLDHWLDQTYDAVRHLAGDGDLHTRVQKAWHESLSWLKGEPGPSPQAVARWEVLRAAVEGEAAEQEWPTEVRLQDAADQMVGLLVQVAREHGHATEGQ